MSKKAGENRQSRSLLTVWQYSKLDAERSDSLVPEKSLRNLTVPIKRFTTKISLSVQMSRSQV